MFVGQFMQFADKPPEQLRQLGSQLVQVLVVVFAYSCGLQKSTQRPGLDELIQVLTGQEETQLIPY